MQFLTSHPPPKKKKKEEEEKLGGVSTELSV